MHGKTLTIDDIAGTTGCSRPNARLRAHRLARRGALERLARGAYRVALAEPVGGPPIDLLPLLVPGGVLSHGSACAVHGLCPIPDVLVAAWSGRRRIVRTTRGTLLLLPDPRKLSTTTVSWSGTDVPVRSLEAAVVDAVEAPRHAGGIEGVLEILARAAPRLRRDDLSSDLERRGVSAIAQKLGLLLDVTGLLTPELRAAILRHVRPGVKVHLGPRGGGRLDAAWNVVVNIPLPRAAPASVSPWAEEPPGAELPVALL